MKPYIVENEAKSCIKFLQYCIKGETQVNLEDKRQLMILIQKLLKRIEELKADV